MSLLERYAPAADEGVFRPQLTSLVDVMTILLVFLIKSFSAEGTIVTPAEDLQLPLSTSDKTPRLRCSIIITKSAVVAEGEVLAPLTMLTSVDSLLVPNLFSYMRTQNSRAKTAGQSSEVIIQCDRDVEYVYVKKVMYTCSKAGCTDYSVLVLQEE